MSTQENEDWAARRRDYRRYLASPRWSGLRERVLRRDGHLCQSCLSNPATEVHHRSYRSDIASDSPAYELIAVCRDCHKQAHSR
jgi:5-methylcytosine-specific restriction endonuclease McrA